MKKVTLYVDHMVCHSCEKTVCNEIQKLKGVVAVQADYGTGRVTVESGDEIDIEDVENRLINLGYPSKENIKIASKWKAPLLILLGGVVLLFLSNNQSLVEIIDLNSKQSYVMLFIVGVLTSFHCVFMCGGIAMSQAVGKASANENIKSSVAYNIGRVISYTIIGGIVGGIGSLVMVTQSFRGAVTIGAGLFMLVFGLKFLGLVRLPKGGGKKQVVKIQTDKPFQNNFVVGLLNGFMPCGPLQTMQLYALGTGGVLVGALSMLAFSLGTVPLMVGIGIFTSSINKGQSAKLMKVSALVVMMLGLIMVNRGLALYGVTVPGASFLVNNTSQVVAEDQGPVLSPDGFQEITLIATGSSYVFEEKEIKVGIPVRINLDVQGISRCSNPLVIPKFDLSNDMLRDEPVMEFTPTESGSVRVTCWMGMITTSLKVVD